MNKATIRLVIIFVAVLIGSALLVYFLLGRAGGLRNSPAVDQPAATAAQKDASGSPEVARSQSNDRSVLDVLIGPDVADTTRVEEGSWDVVVARMFLRFLIAALFASGLAFRWRRGVSITKRNPYVAQTQILLAVVAAAMMMIVGDSAARAFGIFAAASLVRFRTNIRDPKETTVLLVCLGVGLACGVGRLDMALILTVFVLFTLWILERFEAAQVFRRIEVRVETRNLDQTRQVLQKLFERHRCSYELRQLEREAGEGENGKIVYELSLGGSTKTDQLSEEILAEDAQNIAGLEWDQKKSSTYLYN